MNDEQMAAEAEASAHASEDHAKAMSMFSEAVAWFKANLSHFPRGSEFHVDQIEAHAKALDSSAMQQEHMARAELEARTGGVGFDATHTRAKWMHGYKTQEQLAAEAKAADEAAAKAEADADEKATEAKDESYVADEKEAEVKPYVAPVAEDDGA